MRLQAAEQGVSKQAIHFKTEADTHHSEAEIWLSRSMYASIALLLFSVASLFIHKIPVLNSQDPYQLGQIAISKILMFGVLAYALLVCVRNFLSHRHNEVINRHRQNALATFTALAEAASDAASADIVLSHAAACIFSPQDTGYAKAESRSLDAMPSMQLLPRIAQASQSSA